MASRNPAVITITDRVTSDPGGPTPGARYIVQTGYGSYATGDIIEANNVSFNKYTPPTDCGWIDYVQDENRYYTFQDSAWVLGMDPAASSTVAGLTKVSTQALMETGTATDTAVLIGHQKNPSISAWAVKGTARRRPPVSHPKPQAAACPSSASSAKQTIKGSIQARNTLIRTACVAANRMPVLPRRRRDFPKWQAGRTIRLSRMLRRDDRAQRRQFQAGSVQASWPLCISDFVSCMLVALFMILSAVTGSAGRSACAQPWRIPSERSPTPPRSPRTRCRVSFRSLRTL
jgi:hypothetical protein